MTTEKNITIKLDSSILSGAEYDPFMRVLTVTFHSGGIYEYIDVEPTIINELKEADSAGTFFHEKIRGEYEYLRRV